MIILFPSAHALQLALTSGLIPESLASAPAEFATHADGRVWVRTGQELNPSAVAALKSLGVSIRKTTRGADSDLQAVACWPQLLPLEKNPERKGTQNGLSDRLPVLFDLPESANLADVVSEMLRLGNDRQAFRQQQTPDGPHTLLLVKGPPYYTLLRAIDRPLDGPAAPRAFVERHPRVWVEYGYSHPLAGSIQPAGGKILLLARPRQWTMIDEGKFRDIYEVLRFTIPGKPVRWDAGELPERLKVRLRLTRGGGEDSPELWVLSEAGVSQLEKLVQSSDDRLISRLAFAVGASPEKQGERVVVVKARPGKEPPPVLVLDGAAFRSYLRIPNLFLPVGYRLHPPLRRDAVKQLLAADADLDTWLLPGSAGQFVPQSMPDNAFRPLSDWVDYVLDSNRDSLTTWREAMRFEFESFICADEEPDHPPPGKQRPRETVTSDAEPSPPRRPAKKDSVPAKKPAVRTDHSTAIPARVTAVIRPSELQLKLQALEEQFRELPGPLDSPARQPLWRELAKLNMALGHKTEGAVCHVHGLWEQATLPPDWIREWFEAETGMPASAAMSGDKFHTAFSAERPTPSQLNLIAIHVIQAAFGETAVSELARDPLRRVQQQLERFEKFLPVRIAWLAWLGYVKLAGHDLLTLARTRDRVLERLHQQGPSPELDLPGFLRSSGPREGSRFRAVQEALRDLRGRVHAWIERELVDRTAAGKGQTAAYADLMLAYGYSRAGLIRECQDLLEKSQSRLRDRRIANEVHAWLFEAFRFRITQSLQGKHRTGTLPEELMKPLIEKTLDPNLVFILDSFRARSDILQPHEQISAHTRYLPKGETLNLSAEVEHLSDIENRAELAARVRELLEQHGGQQPPENPQDSRPGASLGSTAIPSPNPLVLLSAVLPFGPRLGEANANELVNQVLPTLEVLTNPSQQAVLLDKALFVAAHFGQTMHVRLFVDRLHRLFESAGSSETAGVFGQLLGQSFRGLRKLGMRGEISTLLDQIDKLLQANRFEAPPAASPKGKKTKSLKSQKPREELHLARKMDDMTLRLNLAAGWFYFGNDERAQTILEEVAEFLYQEQSLRPHLRRAFARQYARALEHAPLEVALPKLAEMFEKLTNVTKGFGAGIQDQYYAYELLEVVEAVVLAMVSDDMTLDPKTRRLMEEVEFSIRQRVHRDMEQARHQGGA